MEHKIGEIVTLPDGRKARIVHACYGDCTGCIFYEFPNYDCSDDDDVVCCGEWREDGEDIIYKEVEN